MTVYLGLVLLIGGSLLVMAGTVWMRNVIKVEA